MGPETPRPTGTGRPLARIERPHSGEDYTFAAQRLDRGELRQARYRHCTFENVSFKETLLDDCVFEDCIFVGCYFRRARLRECVFKGCRFYDCEFPRVSLAGCRLIYVRFTGCQIAFDLIRDCLPQEPNLREELCRNLARQSYDLGLTDDGRRFRRVENDAREAHLKNGFAGESEWYRKHFRGTHRVRAFIQWLWSKANRFFWGYCESGPRLAVNFLVTTAVVFPLLYWLFDDGAVPEADGDTTFPYLLLSISSATPASFFDQDGLDAWPLVILMAVQGIYSVVLVAMFAAFLFRWSSRK